jgi:hypothetical protein
MLDIYTIMNHGNNFWCDVFQSWLPMVKIIKDKFLVKNCKYVPMWYITNICVGNECMHVNTWYEHSVKIIADFPDEDGNFSLQQDFSQKVRLNNICTVQYNSIINSTCISKFFNAMSVTRSDVKKVPFYFEPILLNKKNAQKCYMI